MPQQGKRPLPTIEAAVRRYEEQEDRYRKLVEYVGENLQRELLRRSILSTVQWRAKSPESLRRKLHKKELLPHLVDAERALAAVQDLAAVRICTYRDADRTHALDIVEQMFAVDKDSIVIKDLDRVKRTNTSRWYRATHLQLRLPPERLTEQLRNLREDTCEVQICSLLQHAFNEVEHDIAYKPAVRPPSQVIELLHRLGEWRETGDHLIDEILAADEKFRAELLQRPIYNFPTFVSDIADRLPINDQDAKLHDLHRALMDAEIRQASELWNGVRLEDFYIADELIRDLCHALEQAYRILGPRGFAPLLMDVDSTADRLLVALLPRFAEVFSKSSIKRLATISKAYLALARPEATP